jgi:lipopolysaccharide transport system ATP-binding protein
MSTPKVIEIKNLSKKFKVYERHLDRLKEWFSPSHKSRHREYWALKNLTLHVEPGTVYGLVGMNGAGKSTLLKVLTGTLMPTSGTCKVNGRVSALLELGAGFHPELTGRDNVLVNGRLHGLTSAEILSKMDEIKHFSELGDYFDQPVRTYSSGMYVRLAFALASAVKPDVLIIDEALSVGDAYFQQKCLKRIQEFKKSGTTILFVSHDVAAVKMLCDRAALLDRGSVLFEGTPVEVLERYNALIAKVSEHGREYLIEEPKVEGRGLESGSFKAVVERVEMTDESGQKLAVAVSGQAVVFTLEVTFREKIINPTVGILIRDRLGYDIFGINTHGLGLTTKTYQAGESGKFTFKMILDLGVGDYTVSTAIHASMQHTEGNYHWADRIMSFQVAPDNKQHFVGVARLRPSMVEA